MDKAAAASLVFTYLCALTNKEGPPQSETTYPLNPQSLRSTFVNNQAFKVQGTSFSALYADMMEADLPSFTHASKAGR